VRDASDVDVRGEVRDERADVRAPGALDVEAEEREAEGARGVADAGVVELAGRAREVGGVRVAVVLGAPGPRGLVVDAGPDDAVVAARRERRPDAEEEAAVEGDAEAREERVALGRRQVALAPRARVRRACAESRRLFWGTPGILRKSLPP